MKKILFSIILIFLLAACSTNRSQPSISTTMLPPTIFASTQTPILTDISTPAPISIFKLPGPPEEISKPCQLEGYNDYYYPSMRGSSPDGTWQFVDCLRIYDCETHSHYVMHNSETQYKSWVVANEEISSLSGDSPFGWHVAAWSENNQSAYMVYEKFCEHFPCIFVDAQLVIEMNMTSRLINDILPPDRELSHNYALAFSPDSKTLAYIETGTQELIIKNLETNIETKMQLSDSELWYGDISWSPDGERLVMLSSLREEVWDFSLWLIDISYRSVVEILSDEDRDFFPAAWTDNDTISLHLFGGSANEPYKYLFIVSTGELTPEPTQNLDQD